MPKSNDTLLELEGYFWWLGEVIPEGQYSPANALPGVLTISEDGLGKLVVTGSLMMSKPISLNRVGRLAAEHNLDPLKGRTIAGWVEKGFRRVYLRNLIYRGPSTTAGRVQSERFHAGFSLIGRSTFSQYNSELTFTRLEVDLSGLEAWRWSDAIILESEKEDATGRFQTVRWQTDAPEYALEEGMLRLRTDVHCNQFEGFHIREVAFRQYDRLDFLPKSPQSPELLKQEFGYVEEFLALLTGVYFYLDWPQVSNRDGESMESFTLYFQRFREKVAPLEIAELWTTFPQIEKEFGAFYEAARGMRIRYGSGFYLRLSPLRSDSMYIEHVFVNLMWGLESLHRVAHPELKGSARQSKMIEGFRTVIETQKGLRSDERRWFERAAEIASEPRLEDRLYDLFSSLPWQIESSSLAKFASQCADRRNDLSHHGGPRERGEGAYESFMLEVMKLNGALSILYHATLLKKIGFDDAALCLPVQRNPVYFRLRQLLTQVGLSLSLPDERTKDQLLISPPK
jgi:hypothetical protein